MRASFRRFVAAAALVAAAMPLPSAAQSVFDMGALTQSLSIPSGGGEARHARQSGAYRSALKARKAKVSRADRVALTFRRDSIVTRRVQQTFLDRVASSPEAVASLKRSFADDLDGTIAASVRPFGLRSDNLADALAVYLVTTWQATHAKYDDVPAQYQAVSRQMTLAIRDAGLTKASDSEKQELADTVLYEAASTSSGLNGGAKNDPSHLALLAKQSSAGTVSLLGFDVADLKLTNAGLGF